LIFSVIGSAMIVSGIRFQLRPEISSQMILRCGVPHDRPSKFIGISGGQCRAYCRLYVEPAKSFAQPQGGSEARVGAAILVTSSRNCDQHPGAYDVVAMLGVTGKPTVFRQERHVACAIRHRRRSMFKVWRQVDIDLGISPGYKAKTLAGVIVPRRGPGGTDLTDEVRSSHLNQADIGRGQGRRPCRLLRLRRTRPRFPPLKEIILGM
jgi:hypothetical protein